MTDWEQETSRPVCADSLASSFRVPPHSMTWGKAFPEWAGKKGLLVFMADHGKHCGFRDRKTQKIRRGIYFGSSFWGFHLGVLFNEPKYVIYIAELTLDSNLLLRKWGLLFLTIRQFFLINSFLEIKIWTSSNNLWLLGRKELLHSTSLKRKDLVLHKLLSLMP